MGRDPIRAASAPIASWATSRPAGAPNRAIPNCPGESSSRSWIAGSRAYQELNTAPCRKKVPVTDTRALDAAMTNRPTNRSLRGADYGWTPRQDSLNTGP